MDDIDDQKRALIDRYLIDQLSVEEQQQFDLYMEEPAFREELELQKEILEVVENQGDIGLKKMFQEEEETIKENQTNTPNKRMSIQRIATIAASMLFLLWVGWQIFSPKPTDIFAEYFSPHTNALYPKVKSSENLSDIQLAFYYYDEGVYENALLKFETLPPELSNDDVSFYYANVLLELGKTKEAINVLRKIVQNNQTNFLAPAKWNLALAYISLKSYEYAKTLLLEIQNDPFYQGKVNRVLSESVFESE